MLTKPRRFGVFGFVVVLLLTTGCQVTTNSGMYRAFFRWRAFRDGQLVLQRAPLSDSEPGLWGPKLKTHALKWHDQSFDDARYAYTPRQVIPAVRNATLSEAPSATPAGENHLKDEASGRKIPWAAANQPARLDSGAESGNLPPEPPPGDLLPEPTLDAPHSGKTESNPEQGLEEIPLPPPVDEGPIAEQPGRSLSQHREDDDEEGAEEGSSVKSGEETSDQITPSAHKTSRLFNGRKARERKEARRRESEASGSEVRQISGGTSPK